MNTSLSWIKKYVPDLDVSAQEYADAMTLSGTKVENYEELDKNLDKIVVGEILSCEPHPMISIHPEPLQKRQPLPPHLKQETSTSADGSVNGK